MVIYQYDGTIEGLFCAFELALDSGYQPAGFADSAQPGLGLDLFAGNVEVETDAEKAQAFGEKLHRLDRRLPGELIRAFLAEQDEGERLMFDYLRLIARHGGAFRTNLADPVVRRMQKLLRTVAAETHRLKGLLRFEELEDGLLWASFEPAYNVSVLLVAHFTARLRNHRWVMCDVRRGTAIYYDGARAQPVELENGVLESLRERGQLPGRNRSSDPYKDLWRCFFRSVSIAERRNPKQQRSFMPKRFWQWLPEKS